MASHSTQRAYIEKIRLEKFSIGASSPNPLASTLHQAIRHLSAELYQKDVHFISELIQNSEDNSYAGGVEPELDIVVTKEDIAGVGAPATFVLYNNELGFQPANISALCNIGHSTKKGQREEGFIGEKGIGFKSVFLVTSTPYVISNGFRIRFTDSGAENEAGIGYIVPQWMDSPTDETLRRLWQSKSGSGMGKMPSTAIVLPLRSEKVAEVVRTELDQLSPETILFLRKLTRISIRDESKGSSEEVQIRRSDSSRSRLADDAAFINTTLSVLKASCKISESCDYFMWEQKFGVSDANRVEERKEVKTWAVTLAFPHCQRMARGNAGDVYAFLPSQLQSGFPFIINADFLLVSSRETLRFDSPWNQGILDCIPATFRRAWDVLLRKSPSRVSGNAKLSIPLAIPHVYKFVPVEQCAIYPLEVVRIKILKNLETDDSVLVAPNIGYSSGTEFCKPSEARQVTMGFRSILERAYKAGAVSSYLLGASWYVMNKQVQGKYKSALKALKVSAMSKSEYQQFLNDSEWLMKLPEDLYLDILACVSDLMKLPGFSGMVGNIPILKHQLLDDPGSSALISMNELKSKSISIYISPPEEGKWLAGWMSRFAPWISYRFMPVPTVSAIKSAGSAHEGVEWLRGVAQVTDISVKNFASNLMSKLEVCNVQQTLVPATFVMLVWKFIYTSIRHDVLDSETFCKSYKKVPVVNESSQVRWVQRGNAHPSVLLPRSCSSWPLLLGKWPSSESLLVKLSDDFMNLSDDLVPTNSIFEQQACKQFLKNALEATDIPNLPPPNVAIPNLTLLSSNQSQLLLQWMTRAVKQTHATNVQNFWNSAKNSTWMHTAKHGLRRPEDCFFPHPDVTQLFEPSDVPFVDEEFYGNVHAYSDALQELGVVMSTAQKSGCRAIVKRITELSATLPSTSIGMEQIVKLYRYLHKLNWKPSSAEQLQIFIPGGVVRTQKENSWKRPSECVMWDPEKLFGGILPTLLRVYPDDLRSFFSKTLEVPMTPKSDSYCDLWLLWRDGLIPSRIDQCAILWERIARSWHFCSAKTRYHFKANAMLPTSTAQPSAADADALHLSPPSLCFIPDDLQLRSLFLAHSKPPAFVWYPKGFSSFQADLNALYADLGVRKLSECVQSTLHATWPPAAEPLWPSRAGDLFISRGLIVCVVGFLSRTESWQPSERRRAAAQLLCEAGEVEVMHPSQSSFTLTSSSAVTTMVEKQLLGFWGPPGARESGAWLCKLRADHALLKDPEVVREFQTQMLEIICSTIVGDSPTIASNLVDFLKILVGTGFDEAAVEFELRRKNMKIDEDDFQFLQQAWDSSWKSTVCVKPKRNFDSLKL